MRGKFSVLDLCLSGNASLAVVIAAAADSFAVAAGAAAVCAAAAAAAAAAHKIPRRFEGSQGTSVRSMWNMTPRAQY